MPLPIKSPRMKSPARKELDPRTKAINAAMRRAAKVAAARARAAGTKLYVMRNGKLVAETP
jgi:hypothetical protein